LLSAAAKEGRLLMESHELMACSMFHQGQFSRAVEHAQSGFRLYDSEQQYSLLASYGDDPGVACADWEALSLWFLGFPDQALLKAEEAIRLAEDHIYSLANARALALLGQGQVMQQLDSNQLAHFLAAPDAVPVAYPDVARAIAEWLRDDCRESLADLSARLWAETEPLPSPLVRRLVPELN